MDREALLDRVGGDMELLQEIVGIYLAECPVLLNDIERAISSGDAYLLERSAHNLKGCVSNFGAEEAVAAAHALEQMGRQKSLAQAQSAIAKLQIELQRLKPALLQMTA